MLFGHAFVRQCQRIRHARLAGTFTSTLRRPCVQRRKCPIESFPEARSASIDALLYPFTQPDGQPSTGRKQSAKRSRTSELAIAEGSITENVPSKARCRPRNAAASVYHAPKTLKKATAKNKAKLPARVCVPQTAEHWDLRSYQAYAKLKGTDPESPYHRGTCYEYTVAGKLERKGFVLRRTGGAGDRGIDWMGTWKLPGGAEVKVIIQCKLSKPRPAHVREMGYRWGASEGWNDTTSIWFLVSPHPATKGVQNELKAPVPMGFIQMTADGVVKSFFWNHAARESSLTKLSSTTLYKSMKKDAKASSGEIQRSILLSWSGENLDEVGENSLG